MLEDVGALIERSSSFVLTTHARPDGDAIGSVLGFAAYLRAKGKEVSIINCDPIPFNLEWLPGADRVERFTGGVSQLKAIADADVIGVLDANGQERLGDVGRSVRDASGVKLLIDHHTDPESWFDVRHARESVSSTGELIYEVIVHDHPNLLTPDVAVCLYTAIVTDTGSFRYSHPTPRLHRAAADLIERGELDPAAIHAAIYDTKSVGGLKLLSRLLQSLELAHRDQISYSVISRAMLRETGANTEETEGYVNWGLSIEGVRVTMLFTETERGTKVSFRSRGEDHVHKWAQALGGGGHPNASGAFLKKPLDETIDLVLAQAPKYLDVREEEDSDELSDEDQEYLSMLQAGPSRRG